MLAFSGRVFLDVLVVVVVVCVVRVVVEDQVGLIPVDARAAEALGPMLRFIKYY
jgi:hypothetical protein